MRFKGLDLNLLAAFDVLMNTRSVSRASATMNLSQPAMSAALGRLRDYFGDELLVLQSKRMYPTAFAEAIHPQVRRTLDEIEAMLNASSQFDPKTSKRRFAVATSDYTLASLLVPLIARLSDEAPGILIDCRLPDQNSNKELAEGKIDLLITPDYVLTGEHPAYEAYREPQLVIGWDQNPVMHGAMTEDEFFDCGHVAVVLGSGRTSAYADRQIEMMGRRRKIEVTAAFFTAMPWLIEGTMRLGVIHERLARQLEGRFAIKSAPPPFEIAPMAQMISYHPAREKDPALTWLRGRIAEVIAADE